MTISTATKAVTSAYIALAQDLAQSVNVYQIASVDCSSGAKGDGCLTCEKYWGDFYIKNPKQNDSTSNVTNECKQLCDCDMTDVNMSQNINVNFSTFANTSTKADFATQINNSIAQQTKQKGSTLTMIGDTSKNITNISNSIYDTLKTSAVQSSLQKLQDQQVVTLVGAGSSATVSLTQANKFVASVLMNNSQTSSMISKLDNEILQMSTQVASAGLAQLAMWVVRLIALVVILVFLLYSVDLIFDILGLYAA
jgi:hypothetical protein